jgi:hypothetical protein
MPRETARELAIEPATETTIYQDQTDIVRKLGAHLAEKVMVQGTGAAGAGFTITGLPFEPAEIEAINEAGATPALHKWVYPDGGSALGVSIAAAAADGTANAPGITRQAGPPVTWDVAVNTTIAPDTEVVTLLITGFRVVGGSL